MKCTKRRFTLAFADRQVICVPTAHTISCFKYAPRRAAKPSLRVVRDRAACHRCPETERASDQPKKRMVTSPSQVRHTEHIARGRIKLHRNLKENLARLFFCRGREAHYTCFGQKTRRIAQFFITPGSRLEAIETPNCTNFRMITTSSFRKLLCLGFFCSCRCLCMNIVGES